MAAHFRDEYAIPFPLLVDRHKETYRAVELRRGSLWEIAGPPVWIRGMKGILQGHMWRVPKQDPEQLGGVIVAEPGGKVVYVHRSTRSSDNPPTDEVLAAIPTGAGATA